MEKETNWRSCISEMITISHTVACCDDHSLIITSDVSFPPEIFLNLRPEAGHEVVEVHHHVDAHVEEHEEGGVAAPHPLEEDPAAHGHDHVVNHVQRGQLVVLLFQNHEERVHEVCKLGEKVPPHNVCSALE